MQVLLLCLFGGDRRKPFFWCPFKATNGYPQNRHPFLISGVELADRTEEMEEDATYITVTFLHAVSINGFELTGLSGAQPQFEGKLKGRRRLRRFFFGVLNLACPRRTMRRWLKSELVASRSCLEGHRQFEEFSSVPLLQCSSFTRGSISSFMSLPIGRSTGLLGLDPEGKPFECPPPFDTYP